MITPRRSRTRSKKAVVAEERERESERGSTNKALDRSLMMFERRRSCPIIATIGTIATIAIRTMLLLLLLLVYLIPQQLHITISACLLCHYLLDSDVNVTIVTICFISHTHYVCPNFLTLAE
jgi:hypothetical protein